MNLKEFDKKYLNETEAYSRKLRNVYKTSLTHVKANILELYDQLGDEISLKEAKRLLKPNQLQNYKISLNEALRRGNITAKDYNKEFTTLQTIEKISRLEAQKKLIQVEVKSLSEDIKNINIEAINGGYIQANKLIPMILKTYGLDAKFVLIPKDFIEGLQKGYLTTLPSMQDGLRRFETELVKTLEQGLILGKPPLGMVKDFEKVIGKYEKYALMHIRTNLQSVINKTQLEYYKELNVKKYEFIALHPRGVNGSPICTALDKQVFDIKDLVEGMNFPPIHPNCRSNTRPITD